MTNSLALRDNLCLSVININLFNLFLEGENSFQSPSIITVWLWFLVASHSQIAILAIAVGVACGVILILLSIVVAVRFYRRQRMESDIEMPERDDPTVW